MVTPWQPFREPITATLTRTVGIAIVVGGVAAFSMGTPRAWPALAVLVLWPSFGGHWLDLWFLNWLRPRLPVARAAQIAARLATWFAGGVAMGAGIAFTARFSTYTAAIRLPSWWVAGVLFVGVELVAHGGLALRRRPNFYNGAG